MLRKYFPNATKANPVSPHRAPGHINMFADPDHPGVICVVAISNGYLVTARKYNTTGPDNLHATYAADLDGVKGVIAKQTAQLRLDL